MLTPVDEAYALRPSLAHLGASRADAEAKAAAAAAAASAAAAAPESAPDEDEKPAELQPLTVRPLSPP